MLLDIVNIAESVLNGNGIPIEYKPKQPYIFSVNENYTISTSLQGSKEWFMDRAGFITGSEANKLITSTLKISKSDAALDYLQELYDERNLGICYDLFFESIDTWAMSQGRKNESFAVAFLEKMMPENIFKLCGFISSKNGVYGVSPDLVEINDKGEIISGVEIKSPQKKAWMSLSKVSDNISLKKADIKYYIQIQLSLYVTKVSKWGFFLYIHNELMPLDLRAKFTWIYPDLDLFLVFEDIEKMFLAKIS